MSTVTDYAGLSIGIVNFHFESKQKLFEETLVHLAQEHHDHWLKAYKDAGLSAADKLALSPLVVVGRVISRSNSYNGLYFASFRLIRVMKGKVPKKIRR